MYNSRQWAAVSPWCGPGGWRSKADGGLTDGAKDTLGVTQRGRMREFACYALAMRLSKGRAWWSWSNAGWLFRSRGHGSMARSRNLVAGGRDEV